MTTLVIVGATGDLTRRLLFPAIYRLYAKGKWPISKIIGYAVQDWSEAQFAEHIQAGVKEFVADYREDRWAQFRQMLHYQAGDLGPQRLKTLAAQLDTSAIFYLALPPQLFGPAAQGLAEAGLQQETQGWRRLVVEKPFGWDLASARALRKTLHQGWREEQIFRIDHFLGKDTAQNVLVFRFINRLWESVWDAAHIAQVQITYAETLGLEGRVQYYDQAGAMRDMLQNHLLQLFALVAMEPPSEWDADDLHNHKAEVLKAVRPIDPNRVSESAVAGQYRDGRIAGDTVVGYNQEPGISGTSTTETFAALKLWVDNWRWHEVPFYLRSGKRLAADYAEIAVELKPVPPRLFGNGLADWLIFRMKPDEAVEMVLWAKRPGLEMQTEPIVLSAPYKKAGQEEYSAYEQLLLDVIQGDQAHFPRFDEVEEAWRIVDPIVQAWARQKPAEYDAGSQGPREQLTLMEPGNQWRTLPPEPPDAP